MQNLLDALGVVCYSSFMEGDMKHTLTAETSIDLYMRDDGGADTMTLGAWAKLNEYDAADVDEMLTELRSTGECLLGGGAAPAFVIHAVAGSLIGRWAE